MKNQLVFLWRRLCERVVFLSSACDYDLVKCFNALLLLGMGAVLLLPGNYLLTSPRLHLLERVASEPVWMVALLFVGTLEAFLFVVTGYPPLFARTTEKALRWRVLEAVGFGLCAFVFSFLSLLLGPGGASWGIVVFTVGTLGCLYGAARTGRAWQIDQEMVRLKRAKLLATLPTLNAQSVDEIVLAACRSSGRTRETGGGRPGPGERAR